MRLSSDYLFHFKSDFGVFKSILKEGFSHRKWLEKIPFNDRAQENYIVCFSDIRLYESKEHQEKYGKNAIVLTKEWGIRNGISPVRYVHENSPGYSQEYQKMKQHFRDIKQNANGQKHHIIEDVILFSILDQLKKLSNESLQNNFNENSEIPALYDTWRNRVENVFSKLGDTTEQYQLRFILEVLVGRLNNLHNELERRDAFLRVYSENFQHAKLVEKIESRIFYDEREWRSMRFNSNGTNADFLPEEDNLVFTDKDVVAILVEDELYHEELKDYFLENQTLLTGKMAIDKLKVINQCNINFY
jgi:hypothetical protein